MNGAHRILIRMRDDRAGFTLIELVVSMSLMVVVSVVIGSILITTLNSESTVRTSTQATSQGQLIAQSIDKGVRNASWISNPVAQDGSYFLTVHTATGGATVSWECRAWFLTIAGGGAAYTRTSTAAIARPTAGDLSGWTLLATGLQADGTTAMLKRTTDNEVIITFQMDAGDAQNIRVQTSSLSRQINTGSSPCE